MAKKVHPNNPTLSNPEYAAAVLDAARHPLSWLIVGQRLRSSADAIFDRETPVANRFWEEFNRINRQVASGNSPREEFDESRFPQPNFYAAYMLIAFAIENFLKGIATAKQIFPFTQQPLPARLDTHDLYALHQRVTPQATVSQNTLEVVTYFYEWKARYSFPKSTDKFWPVRGDGTFKASFYPWPAFHQEFFAYCDGLERELKP
jgi:hypothetical protein